MARGRIYVLTCESQAGFVKIGKTSRAADERAGELDGTGLALPLEPAYEFVTEAFDGVERKAHSILSDCRSRSSREWFRCSPPVAIAAIRRAVSETPGARLIGEIDYIGAKSDAERVEASAREQKEREDRERKAAIEEREAEARRAKAHADEAARKTVSANAARLGAIIEAADQGREAQLSDATFFRGVGIAACVLAVALIEDKDWRPWPVWWLIGGGLATLYFHFKLDRIKSGALLIPEAWRTLWEDGKRVFGEDKLREITLAALTAERARSKSSWKSLFMQDTRRNSSL